MAIEFEVLNCTFVGRFKVGDNIGYNAGVLCELIDANDDGQFNKMIVVQLGSILEASLLEIIFRAQNFNREGVPNISDEDQEEIAEKHIDKFAVTIDILRKYSVLDPLGADIYEDLHKLRKYRNKVHIQTDVSIAGASRDEDRLFSNRVRDRAIALNWKVLNYLEEELARPEHISGSVAALRLPKLAGT